MIRMLCCATLAALAAVADRASTGELRKALTFHASFDAGTDADLARGDKRLYTSTSGKPADGKPGLLRDDVKIAKGEGRHGDALRFEKNSKAMVFYKAEKNLEYRSEDWSGTISLWLSLDPDKDLEPGYSDPIQVTDKKWNDASLFVDFTKDDTPRKFRLGVFADHEVWNPGDRKWEAIPAAERPMVVVENTPGGRSGGPPFAGGKWTHVVVTFDGFNAEGTEGTAKLYLDGEHQGTLDGRRQVFSWDPSKASIMLGLSYVGLLDDLAIFNRALSGDEVKTLFGLASGARALSAKK